MRKNGRSIRRFATLYIEGVTLEKIPVNPGDPVAADIGDRSGFDVKSDFPNKFFLIDTAVIEVKGLLSGHKTHEEIFTGLQVFKEKITVRVGM